MLGISGADCFVSAGTSVRCHSGKTQAGRPLAESTISCGLSPTPFRTVQPFSRTWANVLRTKAQAARSRMCRRRVFAISAKLDLIERVDGGVQMTLGQM